MNTRNSNVRQINTNRGALLGGNNVHADPEAVEARRSNVDTSPTWSWITGHDESVAACLAILQGKPALYPIFGIQLEVNIREGNEENFPILEYFDAKYGDEGQNLCGKLRQGFWIGVSSLLGNPKKMQFKSVQDELLTLTMLAQPEMQEAKVMYFEEKNHQQQAQETEQRELLKNLRSRVLPSAAPAVAHVKLVEKSVPKAKKVKPTYPKFTKLSDILGDSIGVYNHHSGVTIKVCNHSLGLIVRAHTRDEKHPVYAFAVNNQFLQQADVAKGSFEPYMGENFIHEKYQFMDWIHEALELENEAAGNKPANTSEVTIASQQLAEVATPPAAPVVTAVVDLTEVLGAAATNGVAENGKRGVPAKRAVKPRAPKKVAVAA